MECYFTSHFLSPAHIWSANEGDSRDDEGRKVRRGVTPKGERDAGHAATTRADHTAAGTAGRGRGGGPVRGGVPAICTEATEDCHSTVPDRARGRGSARAGRVHDLLSACGQRGEAGALSDRRD